MSRLVLILVAALGCAALLFALYSIGHATGAAINA